MCLCCDGVIEKKWESSINQKLNQISILIGLSDSDDVYESVKLSNFEWQIVECAGIACASKINYLRCALNVTVRPIPKF